MRVRVLGSAAGGGAPQWNCACAVCASATSDRTQDTVAVSGDGIAWYLINAGPDIRTQILRTPELRAGPGLRQTPLRGVLLTTAELDHTLGLLCLREAVRLSVYATPAVGAALAAAFPLRPMLAQYTDLEWLELPAELELDGGLRVRRLTVGSKRPRYAGTARLPADSGQEWVSALRLTDARSGSSFVHATCLPAWTDAFDAFVDGADEVLLDGTFATGDEFPGARRMGHLPMTESRPHLARHPHTRFRFGHLNNTNPSTGDDIVADGQEILHG
ncbi:MBL fold metallo-hydrolase [Actinoplanes sp. NPDC026619]|uniref:pyrroloquinoline quinone biosynthesis protein PqqB n=1 Tax=Actinoplanes sp. NPDC026619 TaxID=3155798 RepID=UPI0033FE48F0